MKFLKESTCRDSLGRRKIRRDSLGMRGTRGSVCPMPDGLPVRVARLPIRGASRWLAIRVERHFQIGPMLGS